MAKLPQSGITVSMVKQVLASPYTDVGKLCTSDNINMWSKHKPYSHAHVTATTIPQFETAIKSVQWGLKIQKQTGSNTNTNGDYTSVTRVVTDGRNNLLPQWVYVKPTGGASSPYRLGDFRNYYHEAQPPIRISSSQQSINKISNVGSNYQYQVGFEVTPENNTDGGLRLSELYGEKGQTLQFKDMYFGVIMYNGSHYYHITQSSKFNTGSTSWDDVHLTLSGLTNSDFSLNGSDWKLLPFFSALPQTTIKRDTTGSTSTMYVLPFAETTVSIRSYNENTDKPWLVSQGTVVMFTDNTTYNDKIYYNVVLRNNSSNSISMPFILKLKNTFNGNTNEIVRKTITVARNSQYYSSTDSQYPTGSQLVEVDLTKVTGVDIGIIRNAVKNGQLKWEMNWGEGEATPSMEGTVINGYGGDPTQP